MVDSYYNFPCGCKFKQDGTSIKDYDGLPPLSIDYHNIRTDCPKTWDLISSGYTRGVFQIESNTGRSYAKKLEPDNMELLSALISVIRPGCLGALLEGKSMTSHFIDRRHNREPVQYLDDRLEQYTKETYGILVYQEQAINIAKGIAGFTPEQANALRKAIGKKKADELAALKSTFIEGSKAVSGLDEATALALFDNIEASNRYSFNKCISKDTIIRRANGGRFMKSGCTVGEMYHIRNDINYAKRTGHEQLRRKWKRIGNYGKGLSLCDDGRIRPNTIIDIQPSGKMKIYQIILANGAEIKVSINHKFPTPDGIKTVAELLIKKSKLIVCGKYEVTDFAVANRFSNTTQSERIHNGPGQCFTNKSWSEFQKNDLIIPRQCNNCNKTKGRLELHHKDSNRCDSSFDNLERLCSSCHKKQDYKLGRTKRGEKGYPTIEVDIVSINECGEEETYDVTMEAPNHTFVTSSDIVTCNSHAMSYAYISYMTSYVKAHFPLHFACASLKFIKDFDELRDLTSEFKLFDIELLGPSIENPLARFNIIDGRIQYGLAEVKKCGIKAIDEFLNYTVEQEKVLQKPVSEFSWYEFLILLSPAVKSDSMYNLISAGVLDHTGISRKTQLHEYNIFSSLSGGDMKWIKEHWNCCDNLFSLLDVYLNNGAEKRRISKIHSLLSSLENPGRSLEDDIDYICDTETELLGISVSKSKTAGKARMANIKCIDFLLGKGSKNLTFVVEIKDVDERIIKSGQNINKKMANLKVADDSGELEITVFSKEWTEMKKDLVKRNVILLQGSRNQDMSFRIENATVI